MDTAQTFLLRFAAGGDVPDVLGGGRDHILAALIVGWSFYSLVGRRVADDGLRFFVVSLAAAAGLSAPAPVLLLGLVAVGFGIASVLDALSAHRAAPSSSGSLSTYAPARANPVSVAR